MALSPEEQETLATRLKHVQERIERACHAAGRDPRSVRLLAVSKFHPADAIRAAYALGQREFGENYVQELREKAEALSDLPDLSFRFIGHLQRNKARDVVKLPCAVDTVDSLSLAQELAKRAAKVERTLAVLVQVNVGREPQKAGVLPEDLSLLLEELKGLPQLRVQGLMTIPPACDDPEDARKHFRALAELAKVHGLAELSMGMSDDLEIAIEEGATMVRIGTAIFGARA